jgi:hypothetical protein
VSTHHHHRLASSCCSYSCVAVACPLRAEGTAPLVPMLPTPEMPEISIPGSTRVWIIDSTVGGGCRYFEELAIRRSNLLYDMIDGSGGFYNCFVTQERFRSRMQVVFTIGDGCALPVAAVSVCGWIGWHTARGLWRWRIMPAFANACAIRHLLLVPG